MYQSAIYIRISDIAKYTDSQWKNANFGRTQGVCHVIYTFCGSSLGKV